MATNLGDVTDDLSLFGYRELKEAGKLLTAYRSDNDQTTQLMGDGLKVWFNLNSGYVFLADEDYATAMMEGDELRDWLNCPECGEEGFTLECGCVEEEDDTADG